MKAFAALCGVTTLLFWQPEALPGAEGFGAGTPGGRGGRRIDVTTLADAGPGSLRAALATAGPRTVTFRVSGLITLESGITIKDPYVTVDGSSAPGGGVCVRGNEVVIRTHDV